MAMGRMPDDGGDETSAVFSEINITPLTDIFLVLLIIFMVGASMASQSASAGSPEAGGEKSGVEVELPRGGAQDVTPSNRDVSVAILADGRVVIAGEEVRDDDLAAKLGAAHEAGNVSTLIVQADEGVPHGRVVLVMERAREAGFTKLAVATRGE